MFIRNHKPEWTSEELDIIYKNCYSLNFKELYALLPNRSFCAVKNKAKKVKYGTT